MENQSLEITNDSPASLLFLAGELLTKIMSFAMASDMPVFLWVFRNLTHIHCFKDLLEGRQYSRTLFHHPSHATFPKSQQQHLLDWVRVTGTCHRLREYGIPAFFRTKSFVVPARMLNGLLDGRIRSSNLDMAMDWIRKIEVPINCVSKGSDFLILPKYHRFAGLSAMTIRVPDSQNRILWDSGRERPWPQETPQELHNLLKQLGLRLDITKLKLVMMATRESVVPSLIESMERGVYPLLRILIQRRAKPGVTPP